MGGKKVTSLLPSTSPSLSSLADATKNKAYSIIAAKGATSFGIASVVSSLCETFLLDQRDVRPVSHWIERFGCCVSLPAVLGRSGIQKTLDVPLDDEEQKLLDNSVNAIKECIREVSTEQKLS
jgi:L-lactate dehydrogenase